MPCHETRSRHWLTGWLTGLEYGSRDWFWEGRDWLRGVGEKLERLVERMRCLLSIQYKYGLLGLCMENFIESSLSWNCHMQKVRRVETNDEDDGENGLRRED